jgi:hypothetical protein
MGNFTVKITVLRLVIIVNRHELRADFELALGNRSRISIMFQIYLLLRTLVFFRD